MEKKSFGLKFIETQDKFFKSIVSIFTFVGAIVVFALVQLLLFLFTNFEVSGSSEINHWQSWIYMIISPLGASLSLLGYIYTVRIDKKFFIPTIIGQSITLISSFLGGMTWTGCVMFVIIFFGVVRLWLINKYGTDYKINFKKINMIGVVTLSIFSIIGIIMALIEPIYNTFWYTNDTSITYRILDILTANLAIYGSILLICKNKNAFYIFTFCNVIFIGMFAISGLWINSIQLFIYIICNICAAAAWTYKDKHLINK